MHDVVQTNPSSCRPVPRSVLLAGVSYPHVDPRDDGHQPTTLSGETPQRKLRFSRQNLRSSSSSSSYLHSRSPPLVHHDLSPNNVLLNEVSLQAKVTDFGMTQAMDPSKITRKSSAKGTQVFMPPEALHSPPRYDEKLDVFSYGNVIVTTVIHDWPEPGPPTKYEGDKLIELTEFQRREQYLNRFNQIENSLFLPIVSSCLENHPHQRPSSFDLVTRMREIEESQPRVPANLPSTVPLGQDQNYLIQEMTVKENTIRQKDIQLQQQTAQLREQDAELKQQHTSLQQKDAELQQKNDQLEQKDTQLREQAAELEQHHTLLQQKDAQLQQKDAQLREQAAELEQHHTLLQQKDAQLKQKDAELRLRDEESGHQYAILLHDHEQLQLEHNQHLFQRESSYYRSLSAKLVSCSHLFVSIKPYITTHDHYPFPLLNGLSYIA